MHASAKLIEAQAFIVGLLENLGSHINPIRLVQRIPNGLEIPGLRNALIKIMSDYGIQVERNLPNDDFGEILNNLSRNRCLCVKGARRFW